MSEVVHIPTKERLFDEAATLYFDLLREDGKPPRLRQLYSALSEKLEMDEAIIKSLLYGSEFDSFLISRRKRRIIEEAALKVTAAEYAERIATGGLARLVDLIENDDEISAKDLIAAVKLASDLNAKVDQSIEEVTGSGDVNINIRFKELLLNVPAERRAALMGETMRRIGAPGEVIDGSCDEG